MPLKENTKLEQAVFIFDTAKKTDQREVDILTGYAMACASEQAKRERRLQN